MAALVVTLQEPVAVFGDSGRCGILAVCDMQRKAVAQMTDKLAGWNPDLKNQAPDIRPGDTVRVHLRIIEGDRERIQAIQGVVMRMHGEGEDASFTVRRIAAHGIGVERTFPTHSPRLERVEILRRAKVRRAQLYYLRKYRGKAARMKEDRSAFERSKA